MQARIATVGLLSIWLTVLGIVPSIAHASQPPTVQEALAKAYNLKWGQMSGGPYRRVGTANVFLILNGYKFEIPDHQTFVDLYGKTDATKVAELPRLDDYPSGEVLPVGSELVASRDDPRRVFLLVNNMRHMIGSWPTFFAYNLSETRVTKLSNRSIHSIPEGASIGISPAGTPTAKVKWDADDLPTPPRDMNVISSPVLDKPFARGFSALDHGDDPESWVRASATCQRDNGVVSFTLQLETDSVSAGPKGRMQVVLRDATKDLVTIDVAEIEMGGKIPGPSRIRSFHGQATVPIKLAARVTSVGVTVQHTGSSNQLFGIPADDVIAAIKVAVIIAGI